MRAVLDPNVLVSALLSRSGAPAHVAADPVDAPARSPDPGDDYLLALAEAGRALLVSGDGHLLGLRDRYPVQAPGEFLDALARSRRGPV